MLTRRSVLPCRLRYSKEGFPGQALGEQPALLLLRGKAGRFEAPPGLILDAILALIQAGHIPASAALIPQARLPAPTHCAGMCTHSPALEAPWILPTTRCISCCL